MTDNSHPVLYFDGVCNLCNATVQFIIRKDKKAQCRFASLQSVAGQAMLNQYQQHNNKTPNSIILQQGGRLYIKSTAALRVLQLLGGVYQLAVIGFVFPRFIRDAVYDVIASNRYRWFGKKDSCMMPTAEWQSRFLD